MSPMDAHGLSNEPSAGGITRSEPRRNAGSLTDSAPLIMSMSLAVRIRSPSIAWSSVRTPGIWRICSETRPVDSNARRCCSQSGSLAGNCASAPAAWTMRARTSRFFT